MKARKPTQNPTAQFGPKEENLSIPRFLRVLLFNPFLSEKSVAISAIPG
jgi:hypothetical protein